jgi:uncharacterized protein YndB with AHSA1/START domain
MSPSDSHATTRQVGKMSITVKGDREVALTRVFDAPRRLVWEALSKAEHYPHWWGLRSHTMTACELDFRPGGRWRFVVRDPDGNEHAFRGEIREVVPPERIVQTFEYEGMPGAVSVETLTLTEQDGKTTLTSASTFDSAEAAAAMLQSGMELGAAETYDRLEEYLRRLA